MIIARALEKCIPVMNHSTVDCLRRAWIYRMHVIMIVIECAFILNNMFSYAVSVFTFLQERS